MCPLAMANALRLDSSTVVVAGSHGESLAGTRLGSLAERVF